jgi:hypothetical protein
MTKHRSTPTILIDPPPLSDEAAVHIFEFLDQLYHEFLMAYEQQILKPDPHDPPDVENEDWDWDHPPF